MLLQADARLAAAQAAAESAPEAAQSGGVL
jgi:hypothetical protein